MGRARSTSSCRPSRTAPARTSTSPARRSPSTRRTRTTRSSCWNSWSRPRRRRSTPSANFEYPVLAGRRDRSDHRRARRAEDRSAAAVRDRRAPQGGERAGRQGRLRPGDADGVAAIASACQRCMTIAVSDERVGRSHASGPFRFLRGSPPSGADRRRSSLPAARRPRLFRRCAAPATSGRTSSPTCCRTRIRTTVLLLLGVGAMVAVIGVGTAWLVTDVPLSRPRRLRMGAAPAARGADLHRRLRLSRRAASGRAGADDAARAPRHRAAARPLVPGNPLARRLHLPARRGALPLRLPAGARALPDAVGRDARSGAHARRRAAARVLPRRAAAGAAGHRRRRQPRADGGAERHRRLGISRHPHADGRDLHDLDGAHERRGRGADRARHARRRLRAHPARALGAAAAALFRARRGGSIRRRRSRSAAGGAAAATLACSLPILFGFLVPASYLVVASWRRYQVAGPAARACRTGSGTA